MVTKLLVLCAGCNFVIFDSSAWYVVCLLICCLGLVGVVVFWCWWWCFWFWVFSFLGLLDLLVFCSVCLVISVEWFLWFGGVHDYFMVWCYGYLFVYFVWLGWNWVFGIKCLFTVCFWCWNYGCDFLVLLLLYILHYLIVILLV